MLTIAVAQDALPQTIEDIKAYQTRRVHELAERGRQLRLGTLPGQ